MSSMRLAKLKLSGFKSFADPTEFRFDEPVTCVVGPNGCGKSNIVDAIKWVLGERSAKSLRGQQMMDVIFGGTTNRKPMDMAEVVLVFDNPPKHPGAEDRILPVPTDVVEIGRRLYRDGRSHYLINNRKSRLRDVRELFMDTGVGADAYSIIEQGKVDAMLTSNPKERRIIFEEAAGVAKFKARRVEAMRKLERTEVNLVRCREQLASAERRLRFIRGQAEKARKFKALDEELATHRRAHALDLYHELRTRREDLEAKARELEAARTEAGQRLAEIESEKQDAEVERHGLQSEQRQVEQDRMQLQAQRDKAQQRRDMCRRSTEDARAQIAAESERIENLRDREEQIRGMSVAHHAVVLALQSERDACEQRVEDAMEVRQRREAALNEQMAEVRERRAELAALERDRTRFEAEIESINHRLASLDEQSAGLEERAAKLDARATELRRERNELDERRRALDDSLETDEATLKAHEDEAQSLGGRQREISVELSQAEQEFARIDSRRHTLQEMIDAGEGIGDAVRQVLEHKQTGDRFGFVSGLLADVIETDVEHAAAVESAFGSLLQAVLVPRLTDVMDARDDLSQLSGRVAFLAVDAPRDEATIAETEAGAVITTRQPDRAPLSSPMPMHAMGRAAIPMLSCVEIQERFRPAIERLLMGTWLVEDLETALLLSAQQPGARHRFVTREGEVLEPTGRIIAGPNVSEGMGAGLLLRRTELEDLEGQAATFEQRIEDMRAELASIDGQAAELDRRQAEVRQRVYAARTDRDKAVHAVERIDSDVLRIERDRPALDQEQRELDRRRATLRNEQASMRADVTRLASSLTDATTVVASLDEKVIASQNALDEAKDHVTGTRVAAGQTAERLAGAEREGRQFEQSVADVVRQVETVEAAITQRTSKIEEYERMIADAETEATACDDALTQSEVTLKDLTRRLADADQRTGALAEQFQVARASTSEIEGRFHDVSVQLREAEVKQEGLEQRTIEELSLDLGHEYSAYLFERESPDFEPIERDIVAERISELRRLIKKLGNVNLDAIDEEETLENQNVDLAAQVEDLDQAREQLTQLIQELSEVSRDRFKETFEIIKNNFAGTDGMFRRLFGGGRADIMLMPDEETGEIDWLESGVEIIAKPPGKEPRSIKLLSGGEKTMTSVALLMAIFKSKPSPFCILDEVDAALDDANVERFANVIRGFLDKSHFIVITHNKRTMQGADQMYGITMQERGVSKRVSVKFEDVAPGGRVSSKAVRAAEAAERERAEQAAAIVESRPVVATAIAEDPANGAAEESDQVTDALAKLRAEAGEDGGAAPVEAEPITADHESDHR